MFICHAGLDRTFIAMLHDEMLKCGLRTFDDIESLEMGDSVQNTVVHAIVNSPFFVVVLSSSFRDSLHPESQVEAALAFPRDHKKIIPVFYEISIDGCHQSNKEIYHKLAAIKGLRKGFKTDEQFAKWISRQIGQMAVEQLQSSKLLVCLSIIARRHYINGHLSLQTI